MPHYLKVEGLNSSMALTQEVNKWQKAVF
jgi:hypothetical protein